MIPHFCLCTMEKSLICFCCKWDTDMDLSLVLLVGSGYGHDAKSSKWAL